MSWWARLQIITWLRGRCVWAIKQNWFWKHGMSVDSWKLNERSSKPHRIQSEMSKISKELINIDWNTIRAGKCRRKYLTIFYQTNPEHLKNVVMSKAAVWDAVSYELWYQTIYHQWGGRWRCWTSFLSPRHKNSTQTSSGAFTTTLTREAYMKHKKFLFLTVEFSSYSFLLPP